MTVRDFRAAARRALADAGLQQALARSRSGFVGRRREAVALLPEFEALRDQARAAKDHALAHLDVYLQEFEARVHRAGGQVHWAEDTRGACAAVLEICRRAGARRVIKGKSMASEEIGLNPALEAAGLEVLESDLGEYILQLAGEPPSHIIAPALHKNREQVVRLFREHHPRQETDAGGEGIRALVDQARRVLRRRFLEAEVGITGANALIAETGATLIVTNEGNADLAATLPRVHIVTAGIDKLVATLDDAGALLRVLASSATGQAMSAYTSLYAGPRRPGDADGPEEFHVVLIDNGRSRMLGTEFQDMLRCIRCGACLNHCPVYGAVGGHAYEAVYPGPMGAVLTPLIEGLEPAYDLPNACTLNGRCEVVCPVRIPLPRLLRALRRRQFEAGLGSRRGRLALKLWAFAARRPWLYRQLMAMAAALLNRLGRRRGSLRRLPLAGGWTAARDLPAPRSRSFMQAWRAGERP